MRFTITLFRESVYSIFLLIDLGGCLQELLFSIHRKNATLSRGMCALGCVGSNWRYDLTTRILVSIGTFLNTRLDVSWDYHCRNKCFCVLGLFNPTRAL